MERRTPPQVFKGIIARASGRIIHVSRARRRTRVNCYSRKSSEEVPIRGLLEVKVHMSRMA
jgi:hypothetical protein